MTLRVAHLISSDGLYGAEKWVLALLKAAHKYDIKFVLINLTSNKVLKSEIVETAREQHFIAFDFHTGWRYNPVAALHLGWWAKNNKIDIFHCHGYKSDVFGLIASRIARCKIITTPHGWSLEKDLKLALYETFDRKLFVFMDKICPLSPELYSGLIGHKLLKNKVRLITNGVDIEDIDSIRSNSSKDNGEFVIGYIGQLIQRKNISILLDAIKVLSCKKEGFKLILVGDGYLRSALLGKAMKLGISPNVMFHGFRRDALVVLKTFDVLVLPSLMEGIPRCVMEAMAANIPVIASDIPGNRDLIIHGETGLLFNPYSEDELVKNIEFVRENNLSIKHMVERARERIEDNFSNHRMAREYVELYHSL